MKNDEKNRPSRQHFVPRFLLRRFTDEQGMLHCFDKKQSKIYKAYPEKAFVVRDLYTLTKPAGKDYSVETGLSGLEAAASGAIDQIIDAARAGMLPALSDTQRNTIDKFVTVQWRRVVERRESDLNVNLSLPELLVLRRAEQRFGPEAVSRELARYGGLQGIDKNAWAIAQLDRQPGWMQHKGLAVIFSRGSRKASLIVGSDPVLLLGENRGKPDGGVALPISSDVAILIVSIDRNERLILDESGHCVRRLNQLVFKQSERIGASSFQLVSAFKRRWSRRRKTRISASS